MAGWRFAAAAAALAAYALLSNWLMVHAAQAPWAVAVLFGPLLLAVAGGAWLGRQWRVLAACAALVLALAAIVAHGGVQDMQRMYVLQHAGIHAALAWGFGITLRPGATPLITAIAARLHRDLPPAMRDYTRWLTRLWVRYFVGMIAVSLAIYALAPWTWWSVYCNLLTPLAALALFVGEHAMRYRRHPDFERVSLRAAFEAYRQAGRADPAARP